MAALNFAFEIFGNSVQQYLISLGVFTGGIVGLWIFKNVVIKYLEKLAEKTETDFDDAIIAAVKAFGLVPLAFFAFRFATAFLAVPNGFASFLDKATIVIAIFYSVGSIAVLLDYLLRKMGEKRGPADESSLSVMRGMVKIVLWLVAGLSIISFLGFNISALLTGLGIGGIAIAFALQHIFTDIFASFSIYFDKPFQVGDFIVVGTDKGTVRKIGIKTTRVTTLEGDELVVSNQELTSTRVRNYKKMEKRKVIFNIGVSCQTKKERLERIPSIIESIVKSVKDASFERCHFISFAESSLLFEAVYNISNGDILAFREIHQKIGFAIKEAFEREGIEIAYPTHTVFLKKDA
ncbi:MAG: mechanosensitive ion channel family protein [archaeon]